MDKTNSMRLLEARKIPYRATVYDTSGEFHPADEAAQLIGAPVETVYKTLVVLREPRDKPLLVMVPAHREVDLRLLAKEVNEKKLRMATQKEAEQLTGLQVGGISALVLLNKGFQIFLDASAQALDKIHISAGGRGVDIEIGVKDLIALTKARVVTASVEPKQIVKAGYNAIAALYLATRSPDTPDLQLLYDFVTRLPQGARVLDAGCGAGIPVTQVLSEHFRVIGVDFSETQINLARALVPNVEFVCADLTALTFPDESFDAITCYYAIIHIPRRQHPDLFANLWRILIPSGLALLCLGANDLDRDIEDSYFGTTMYWSHFDAQTNLKLLTECGFEIVWSKAVTDTLDPSAQHLFVLARK